MEKAKLLFQTIEKHCSENNIQDAEEKTNELLELSKLNLEVREIYSQAVLKILDTFHKNLSSTKIKVFISNFFDFLTKSPTDNNLKVNYAKILQNSIIALSSKGQITFMTDLMKNLEELANKNPNSIIIQEEYSKATHVIVNYMKERGDFKGIKEQTNKLREFAKKYPDNDKIKLYLAKSLIIEIESIDKKDVKKVDNLLKEIEIISQTTPANVGLRLEWVHAYVRALDRTIEETADVNRWVASMKKAALDQKSDEFKLELAKGYYSAIISIGEMNTNEALKLLKDLERLILNTNNFELQKIYVQSLLVILEIIGVKDFSETTRILNEIHKMVKIMPKQEEIINVYADAIAVVVGLLAQQQKAAEINTLLIQLEESLNAYPQNKYLKQVSDQLNAVLKMIGFKRTKEENKKKSPSYL